MRGIPQEGATHLVCFCASRFSFCFLKFISVWVSCMCMWCIPCVQMLRTLRLSRSQRKMSLVLLDHTPPYTTLSLNLGLFWRTASPSDPPISAPPPALNSPAHCRHLCFFKHVFQRLKPRSLCLYVKHLTKCEPSPQSQALIFFFLLETVAIHVCDVFVVFVCSQSAFIISSAVY